MTDKDQIEQMPLFSLGYPEPKNEEPPATPAPLQSEPAEDKAEEAVVEKTAKPVKKEKPAAKRTIPPRKELPPPPQPATAPRSGLVPEGDVRLTANIREDLHLKLKIAAARRRTTIGEIIEELIETYI